MTALFGGLSLVAPGVVPVAEWRPDAGWSTQPADLYAGVAQHREVVAVSGPQPGHGAVAVDGERWREAAQLRHDHVGWAVIWLAEAGEFRAYGRLPGARRDTALSAKTATTWPPRSSRPSSHARADAGEGPG